jgi:aspartate 1-decarboxylase
MAAGPPRIMLKSKLHRARVTQADIDYEGSLTIDRNLLDAANIIPYEEVQVWNVTRGTRLSTYAMEGAPGSGVICINGAAAHLVRPGDIIIIATYTTLSDTAAKLHLPRVVLLDENNHIKDIGREVPGPARREC